MGTTEIVYLILGIIFCFAYGQLSASGNIGNRSYSSWYETHFLVEKKGIFNLIYYKPKHFGRYTLYEVLCFLISFLFPIIISLLAIAVNAKILSHIYFIIIVVCMFSLIFWAHLAIVIINDVGFSKDRKKRFYLESGNREVEPIEIDATVLPIKNKRLVGNIISEYSKMHNNSYFTIFNLKASYFRRIDKAKKDSEKCEKINLEYIERFKNIENNVVIKENKDGTLCFKK